MWMKVKKRGSKKLVCVKGKKENLYIKLGVKVPWNIQVFKLVMAFMESVFTCKILDELTSTIMKQLIHDYCSL